MIRRVAKRFVPNPVRKFIADAQMAPFRIAALERRVEMVAAELARASYSGLAADLDYLSPINQHEFSVSSQNGEDGILLYIFSVIGTSSRRFIEFGIGDGRECNCANLLVNFGWRGTFVDCMGQFVTSARRHYDHVLRTRAEDVVIAEAMITAENVNQVLRDYSASLEVDLVSIDIDGNDYWVWKALDVCRPRVFVVEYAAVMGPDRSITVPYDPVFSRFEKHPSGLYAGGSLQAMVKLGEEKGYTFVGCNRHGVNAFFVRSDLIKLPLKALTAPQGYYSLHLPALVDATPEDFCAIRHLPFVEV